VTFEESWLSAGVWRLSPAPRAELLHVLMLPDFDRADAIGSYWGNPETRTFGEQLIDCKEDRTHEDHPANRTFGPGRQDQSRLARRGA
jgi:hypothetical protein